MKIKALSRSMDTHARSRAGDAPIVSHNLDPTLHPFSKPREYTRALNAAKLDRMHAKPFVAALEGHSDGVYCLARDPNRLGVVGSGSGDGELRIWDLPTQSLVASYPRAHHGIISSVCFSPVDFGQALGAGPGSSAETNSRSGGRRMLSCSTDRTVKLWDADPMRATLGPDQDSDEDEEEQTQRGITGGGVLGGNDPWKMQMDKSEPLNVWHHKLAVNSLSHHPSEPIFASASSSVQTWDITRSGNSSSSSSGALREMSWGAESINVVRFNPSEQQVLAGAGSDRGVVLYDLRSGKALTKMVMQMRANDISWSPIEPTVFALASEDHNMYTFDMRNLSSALQIYKDHVSAVMSVDFSPTGQELVTGSYDRTLRLWDVKQGAHSRDVYHGARMQRIFSTMFTLDARFVLSASDDGNVRVWKSKASEKLGIHSGKERAKREYGEKLINRWKTTGDVGRISKQRKVPKAVKGAQKVKRSMLDAERVKEDRRRKHTRAGDSKPKPARQSAILAQKE